MPELATHLGSKRREPSPRAAAPPDARTDAHDPWDGAIPAVVAVDARGLVVFRDTRAGAYLRDITRDARAEGCPPPGVASALARLRAHSGRVAARTDSTHVELRARGRSGRWYALHASLADPAAGGGARAVVVIMPEARVRTPDDLRRRYGLTPRERDVVLLAARGDSTKQIADSLGLSAYTVQEHIGHACAKAGVRSRRALLAKLFVPFA